MARYGYQTVSNLHLLLNDADMPAVISFLNAHHTITALNLDFNNVGSPGIISLMSNVELDSLNLNNENANNGVQPIDEAAISAIDLAALRTIAHIPSLVGLRLLGDIDEAGMIELASNKHIVALGISAPVSSAVADIFRQNKKITELYIQSPISNQAIASLANMTSLHTLFLEGVAQLDTQSAQALADSHSLNEFFVFSGSINDDNAVMLAKNKRLAFLSLPLQQIADVGALALAHHKYDELDLVGNYITSVPIEVIKNNLNPAHAIFSEASFGVE